MPTRLWSVGAQLAGTLFDGGKRRAQVRLSEAAYDATAAAYRQTVLTAFQQVEDRLAELRILAEEEAMVGRTVAAAQDLRTPAEPELIATSSADHPRAVRSQ